MKEKILLSETKLFLDDFEKSSTTQILEEGKEKEEIIKIAEARGINLKNNTDLSGFKNIYVFADKNSKNNVRFPKKPLLKALPTAIGKPINIDHNRRHVVGHIIDIRYKEKDNSVLTYGVFYKSNFEDEYLKVKEAFKNGSLPTSSEIWCPKKKRKTLRDGTVELQELEIAGNALLLYNEPAFDGTKVLALSKKNTTESDLVFSSKYNDDEIICSSSFEDSVKKNYERMLKEKEEKSKEEEDKQEQPKEEVAEKVHETPKIKCGNCGVELNKPEEENTQCSGCLSILDREGSIIYPPQKIDFNLFCPSCRAKSWLLKDDKKNSAELRCRECKKEYLIDFIVKDEDSDGEKIKEKFNFVYSTFSTCPQCDNKVTVVGTSKMEKFNLSCDKCGLNFVYNKQKDKRFKQIQTIREIIDDQKTKEEEEKVKDETKKTEEKKEETKVEEKKTPQTETPKEEKVENPKEEKKETPKEETTETAKTEEKTEETPKEEKTEEDKPAKSSKEKEDNIEEEPKEKYYKTKTLRKAAKEIKELKKLFKSSLNDQSQYINGIKKTASLVISLRKDLKKIKQEAEDKVSFYKENAKKIITRQEELGEHAKCLSDKDIVNDDVYEKAKLRKENDLLRSQKEGISDDTVGDKVIEKTDEYYAEQRKKINKSAFGEN